MHAAFLVHRDIFAVDETFLVEVIAALVGNIGLILKGPGAAATMHEMAVHCRFARPQPRHPAGFAVLPPEFASMWPSSLSGATRT